MQTAAGFPAPLAGLRVLDLTESLAGPFCTQILADLGAEVIKVERPGGDAARFWGPPFWGSDSALFLSANRNKRSISVDLKDRAGRDVVDRMAAQADVLVQSFRTGVADDLGLGADSLRSRDPRLIYCSITAYGARGPLSGARGYDPLAQAYGGLMSVTGHPGQPPVRIGTSAIDMSTGMWAAIAIQAALGERDRTGVGAHVQVSLLDTALALMSYHLIGYFGTGAVPAPQGSGLGLLAPYEAFPSADAWVMIAAATNLQFRQLCAALEVPDLADQPEYETNALRVASRVALTERLAHATLQLGSAELVKRLSSAGIPCAPILSVPELAVDEQVAANGALLTSPHPTLDEFRSVALPVTWDGQRSAVRQPPPSHGQHTEEVLRELGYSAAEIAHLCASGAVAAPDIQTL